MADEDTEQPEPTPLVPAVPEKRGRGRPKHYLIRMDRGLQPWMKALARWLASAAVGPSPAQPLVQQMANELCGRQVPRRFLIQLRKLPEFRQYLATMEDSVTERARQNFEADYDYYTKCHKEGLEMAMREKDHRVITKYTAPVLDRIAPKRVDMGTGGQTIVIQVTGPQADRLKTVQMAEIVVEKPEIVDVEPTE